MRRGGATLASSRTPPQQFALVEKGIYRSAYPSESNVAYLRQIGVRYVVVLSIERLPKSVRRALDGGSTRTNISSSHYYNGNSEDIVARAAAKQRTSLPVHSDAARPLAHIGAEWLLNNNSVTTAAHTTNVKSGSSPTTSFGRHNDAVIPVIEVADMRSWQNDDLSEGDDFSQADVQRALAIAVDKRFHPVLLTCPLGELQTSVVVGCMRRYQCWTLASIYSECELFATLTRTLRSTMTNFIAQWDPENCQIVGTDAILFTLPPRSTESVGKDDAAAAATSSTTISTSTEVYTANAVEKQAAERHTADDDKVLLPQPLSQSKTTTCSTTMDTTTTPAKDAATTPCDGHVLPASPNKTATMATHIGAVPHTQSDTLGLHFPPYIAEWYVKAYSYRLSRVSNDTDDCAQHPRCPQAQPFDLSSLFTVSSKTMGGDGLVPVVTVQPLPLPHVRYRYVRNPPALDARSTFTKESLVEEDDD